MQYRTDDIGLTIDVQANDSFLDGRAYITVRALEGTFGVNSTSCVRTAVMPLDFPLKDVRPTGGAIERYMHKAALWFQSYLNGEEYRFPFDKLGRPLAVGDEISFFSGFRNKGTGPETATIVGLLYSDNLDAPVRVTVKSVGPNQPWTQLHLDPRQVEKVQNAE